MYQQFNPRFSSSRFESLQSESTQVITVNVVCDGSPSRIRSVRRISLGMTTRPSSSILLTMPVARIKNASDCSNWLKQSGLFIDLLSAAHTSSRVRSLRESGRFMRGGPSTGCALRLLLPPARELGDSGLAVPAVALVGLHLFQRRGGGGLVLEEQDLAIPSHDPAHHAVTGDSDSKQCIILTFAE